MRSFWAYHDMFAALVAMSDGQRSRGARDLAAYRAEAVQDGTRSMEAFIDLSLATLHARMATGEVSGSAGSALRNPAFVLRHVRGAAKRGRGELDALIVTFDEYGFEGFRPTVEFELAKLARHEGRIDDVRRHAQAIVDLLADEPDATFAREATALLAEG